MTSTQHPTTDPVPDLHLLSSHISRHRLGGDTGDVEITPDLIMIEAHNEHGDHLGSLLAWMATITTTAMQARVHGPRTLLVINGTLVHRPVQVWAQLHDAQARRVATHLRTAGVLGDPPQSYRVDYINPDLLWQFAGDDRPAVTA